MNRWTFVGALASGFLAAPLAARAQQPALPVIGFLSCGSLAQRRDQVAAFQRGLNETGYVEGQNVTIVYRWADDHYDRLPGLAGDLVPARDRLTPARHRGAGTFRSSCGTRSPGRVARA